MCGLPLCGLSTQCAARDPGSLVLSVGGIGLVKAYFTRLRNRYVLRNESNAAETQVVFWS